MNTIISKNIQRIAAERGMTIQDIAESSKLPFESVRNIWYGKVANPRVETLLAIGKVFGVTINYLLGEPFITPEESALLGWYHRCGKHGKSVIELVAKLEVSARNVRDAKGTHEIPCVVPRGNIRKGIVYDTNGTIYIPTNVDEAYTAIEMTTNDLAYHGFCKDDKMLFEKRFPEHGEIVAFMKGDKVFIREFREEQGRYVMKCLHNHGEDMIFKRMDEIILVGTCCGVIRAE